MTIATTTREGSRMTVTVRAATDVGLKRGHNEDSYGVWQPDDEIELERRGVLFAVADGMGGSRGGEVASRLAIETLTNAWRETQAEDLVSELRAAVEAANRRVYRESTIQPDLSGMGTTCTAAVIRGAELYVAHVGDSRAYLIRGGRIEQLTQDHSLVAQLVRDRQLTPQQARTDPRRNMVTRSVGIGSDVEVDAARVRETLRPGDTIVLCSDGLHGLVTDDEICAAASNGDLDHASDTLIDLAKQRGGYDNITVILARAGAAAATNGDGDVTLAPSAERASRAWASPNTVMILIAVLLGLFLTLGILSWLVVRMGRDSRRLGAGPDPAVAGVPACFTEASWQ